MLRRRRKILTGFSQLEFELRTSSSSELASESSDLEMSETPGNLDEEKKDKDDKSRGKPCGGGCGQELSADHGGIKCAQDHHFCLDCSQNFASVILSDPVNYLPPNCPLCRVELKVEVIERQLQPEQLQAFTNLMFEHVWATTVVGPGEQLVRCPFCTYMEIRTATTGMNFFSCKSCAETSCVVCSNKLTCDFDDDELDLEDEEQLRDKTSAAAQLTTHMRCLELAPQLQEFKCIMDNLVQRACPGCGLAGMKDDACTHMTCPHCQVMWCYFCGKKEEDCDFDSDEEDENTSRIYAHNVDWQNKSSRCPMYLNELHDHDPSWPPEDAACLEIFHRSLTVQKLKNFREVTIGVPLFDSLCQHFPKVQADLEACGLNRQLECCDSSKVVLTVPQLSAVSASESKRLRSE